MALSKLTREFSELFKTKGTRVAVTPQLYLKLTTKCVKQVDTMVSTSPKFNHEQCQYLADKLKMAVGSAQSFLGLINTWYCTFASDEDMAESVEIFKLLLSLGKAVESFIQGCCQDAWIQSAIELTNVSEHVSSLGFNLELCRIVFSTRENFPTRLSLTVIKTDSLNAEEAKMVREKVDLDYMRLIKDVNALIQSSKSGSEEWQLATFLFGRLKSPSEQPSPALEVPNQSSLPADFDENLEVLNLLGEGSFGTVHKARWLGAEVAKKTFRGEGRMLEFLQETSILDKLRHPNIVSLFACRRTDFGKCYMIMELMDGDLYSLIEKRMDRGGASSSPFTISGALDIMLQMAAGMLFLHGKRIVHRDLKSRNILVKFVKASEANDMWLHAKVADFGLSKTKESSVTYSDQTQNQGTTRWMAPEMIRIRNDDGGTKTSQGVDEVNYPFKSDTYSFAMVCYEILTGKIPFSELRSNEVNRKVLSGERPQLPAECPDGLRTLIEACWSAEPSARPDFGDICSKLRHLKYLQLMRSAWTNVPRCFSLHDIMRMTNNFSRENLLSSRSSPSKSTAYRGLMVHTGEVVAVQRLPDAGSTSSDLDHSKMEMEVFPRLHHHSSVTFIGFCSEKSERILVFEDMANRRMQHEYNSTGDSTGPIIWEANIEAYLTHYLELNMKDLLAFPLQLGKLVLKSALEAHSFRQECLDLRNRVKELIQLLGELSRASKLTANAVRLYERPTRRIMMKVVTSLEKALAQLVRRRRRTIMLLRRVVPITATTKEFRKVNLRLESSIGDVRWLLNISFTGDKRPEHAGLPPIASNDPVLAHVWEQVSIVHVGTAEEKADGAEYLGTLAKGNERNVKIIIEEGGAAPLLRLLKEGTIAGQEAAATALGHLARDMKRVRQLRNVGASTVFTHILDSRSTSMAVQLQVAHVIAKFVSLDKGAQSELASQGAIRLLVALLEHQTNTLKAMEGVPVASVVVRTSSTSVKGSSHSHALPPHPPHESGSDAQVQPVVMDLEEDPEVKLGLKGEAAHALWKLAAGNIENCKLITDTCALLCFATVMKCGGGELKYNSVMAVMEIAAAAGCDHEFRDATFATNSPSAKAVVEQLLEEITNPNGEPELQVSCCRAVGSLAQIFPPPAESPIGALLTALANFEANQDEDKLPVATEAASALRKFGSNCLNLEHYED